MHTEAARSTLSMYSMFAESDLFMKLLILGLIGFGFSGMWLGVFADVGVSLLAVLNSLRAMLK